MSAECSMALVGEKARTSSFELKNIFPFSTVCVQGEGRQNEEVVVAFLTHSTIYVDDCALLSVKKEEDIEEDEQPPFTK